MALTKISGSILKDPLNLGEVSIGGTLTYQDVTNVDSVGIITARSTIDAQGDISIADKIIHTGDTNTAIRFPAADTIQFETAGDPRIRITSTGLVGINETSPSTHLHVNSGAYNMVASFESTDEYAHIGIRDNTTNSSGTYFGVQGNDFRFITHDGSSSAERLRIAAGGNIGIGTDNPGVQLHVLSSSTGLKVQRGNESFSVNANYGGQSHCAFELTNALSIRTGSGAQNERLRITSSGAVGIGTINPAVLTHVYDSTNTSPATEQFRISGGNRTADTFETGFRFFTQSPSANGNRHVVFTSNGNTGLVIQPYETSTGNAASDRVISLCPSGGSVNIGDNSTQTSRSLAVTGSVLFKSTEADIWMESTGPNGVWRILGSTGGNTHQFRIYDNTNAADRLIIDSSGRVVIGATNTTNASANADDLVISGSGQKGITIHSSSYGNIYFSDGTGANHYVGYVQYNHSNNHLNIGAGGAARLMTYDKAGGTNHAVLQVGGSAGNNHYNSYSNASITFGGGNDIENYFLGTRRENYGGDYTKLDLRWHTGIRMGAQSVYGGIRFFNDEDLDQLKFSIMGGGDHVEAHTTFRPGATNTYILGSSGRRWATIYSNNALNTSDRNEKNTIMESDLGLDFICKLKPVSFKWIQREGEKIDTKTHYGLISQDVEKAVIASGKTLDDFGAIDKPEGDDPMGLSYHEFISPLVKAIQEQQEQIKILQEKIASLEGS